MDFQEILLNTPACNDILERPAVNCVVSAVCVCYQHSQWQGVVVGETVPKRGRRWPLLFLLPFAIFMAKSARSQSRNKPAAKTASPAEGKNIESPLRQLSPAERHWVDTTLRKMSVDEKIGQLLFTTYHGVFIPTDSPTYQQMLQDVKELHVGGFILATEKSPFGYAKSQAYPTAILDNQMQSQAKVPLLIGADFERGTAMRLKEGTSFPTQMSIAAGGNVQDAYTMGKITALEARDVGVNWVYAPVSDVNNNPENPIINTRSYGENPEQVAAYVSAYIRGAQDNGVLATAKHFPGHGDTSTDSHIDLPVIHADRERLDKVELVPFRAAIASGVGSIMTGHLSVPALEPDPNTPATLSHNILTGLLRAQLHFQGLVITDAMDMGGITVRFAPGEAAVRAILAGADCLLMPPVPEAAFEALQDAVKSGRISRKRLDASVRRILEAKARLGLNKKRLVDVAALNSKFGSVAWQNEAQDISDRGITLLRDPQHLLPLDGTKPARALLLALSADPAPYPGEDLERELKTRFDSVTTLRADTRFVNAANLKLPPPDSYDVALVAFFVRVSDRKGNLDVPAEQATLAEQLYKSGKPVITLAFGSPYLIESFPQAGTWLSAFGISDVAQISMARALFGEFPIAGHLPVSIPGTQMNAGFGLEVPANPMTLQPIDASAEKKLQPAYDIVDAAIKDKAFPGATLAIGYQGKVAIHAFGHLSYEAKSPAVKPDTMYDLASLTKVIVTTTLAEKLVEGDFPVPLDLDAKIERYLPEWANGPQPEWRSMVTVRHLLTHTSGLPAFKEYWRTSKSKQDTLNKIFVEPLEYEPGTKEIYSDLGIILLGEIIERLTGQPLNVLANENIFDPLNMKDTMYLPPKKLWPTIAPTEYDSIYRHRLIQGQVHDENAYAMGGVSAHAGLFSTAPDLAKFCQMYLNGGVYAHQRIVRRATIAEFTAPEQLSNGSRTLGWAVPTPGGLSGHYFGPHSFGHTGFTGTSIWIDPDRKLFVIFLTNRVNPTRKNEKIQKVRPALHDAIMEALGLVAAPAPAR
jgi:beta-N-acetylhexosaminidase